MGFSRIPLNFFAYFVNTKYVPARHERREESYNKVVGETPSVNLAVATSLKEGGTIEHRQQANALQVYR